MWRNLPISHSPTCTANRRFLIVAPAGRMRQRQARARARRLNLARSPSSAGILHSIERHSVDLDVRFAYDLNQTRPVLPQKLGEFLGRVADGKLVQLLEPGPDLGRLHRAGESRVQAL